MWAKLFGKTVIGSVWGGNGRRQSKQPHREGDTRRHSNDRHVELPRRGGAIVGGSGKKDDLQNDGARPQGRKETRKVIKELKGENR